LEKLKRFSEKMPPSGVKFKVNSGAEIFLRELPCGRALCTCNGVFKKAEYHSQTNSIIILTCDTKNNYKSTTCPADYYWKPIN
jgi:hypothetical protein